jgi:hypothetical protein
MRTDTTASLDSRPIGLSSATADSTSLSSRFSVVQHRGLVTAEGKLYIQGGGWNVLHSGTFPFAQPRIGVAAIVSVPYHATNKVHKLEIRLQTEDGQPMAIGPTVTADQHGTTASPMGIGAEFNIGRPPNLQGGEAQNIPFAINLDHIVFSEPGGYAFVLSLNEEEIERLSFRVVNPFGRNIFASGAGT